MKINTTDLNILRKYTDTPIFSYCRKLIEEGCSDTHLEVYGPNNVLWSVTNIRWGSERTVDKDSTAFVKYIPPKHLKRA